MTAQRQPQDVPIIPAQEQASHRSFALTRSWRCSPDLRCALLFVLRFPTSAGDSGTYIQLARNWADHHVYGLWLNGHLVPTDIRMPGYPAFLAGVAIVVGRSIQAIVLSQAVLDLGTCLSLRQCWPVYSRQKRRSARRVAVNALWLAATCPFIANYFRCLPLPKCWRRF